MLRFNVHEHFEKKLKFHISIHLMLRFNQFDVLEKNYFRDFNTSYVAVQRF